MALGTKVTVAPLLLAGTLSPIFSATPFSSRVPLAGRDLITKLATLPSISEPLSATGMSGASSLPEAEAAAVSGASLTEVTVMVPVAGLLSSRPWLSTEAYWKLVEPFQLALGTKVIDAPLAVAGTSEPMTSATPLSIRVPLAGRDLMTKWSTVPSTSLPPSATGIPEESSLPAPDAVLVSGASLTGATLPKLSSAVAVKAPSVTV
ncbi:hypothetical protein D3C84_718910 [compost metagenome]